MTAWFGTGWNPDKCGPEEQVPTPIGEPCAWCKEPIEDGDVGYFIPAVPSYIDYPYHRACGTRVFVGGYNHLRGTCRCQGGPDPSDPPGMTRREAANLAAATFRQIWDEHQLGLRQANGQ